MKTIEEFLSYLCNQDIKLWVENERLRCSAPKSALTPDIKADLAARKAEILAFISQANQALQSSLESIQPTSRQKNIPLSFAQQRLWFFSQLEPNSSAYNIPAAVKLTGKLNIAALSQSLQEIIRRHEILRTTFTVSNGEPIQVIGQGEDFTFSIIDLQRISEEKKQREVFNLANLEAQKPFDLVQGSLIRVSLLQLSPTDHVVLLTMHHIVSDGWSTGILIKELTALYKAFSEDQPSPLPKLPIQYADFAIWQRKWLQGEVLETQLNYWKHQLDGDLPILELPTDNPRPAIQSNNGATKSLQLSKSLTDKLKNLSNQEGVTLYMTLLAAFKVLLYRYTQQEDIIVGTPIANRDRTEIEGLIGFFVNTLVLRTNLGNNPTFRELLQQVREVTLGAYAHQDLPFEKLVEELQPERNLSHSPLFQVMFILQNASTEILHLPELTIEPLTAEKNTANFDLTLSLSETEAGLNGDLEYNRGIFNADRIARMLGHFQILLEGIVANPEKHLSELPLLTAYEQHQLLIEWNNTQTDYPRDQCIHQLFEAQVEKTPDAIAVVFENEYLTYQELNQRANQVAHYLQTLGVEKEVLVGICVERSLEMIVGIIGILKAGGAYVPLDPNYPSERLAYMLADSQIKFLLTQEKLLNQQPQYSAHLICIDTNSQEICQQVNTNPNNNIKPDNLAYLIYTSGSTGQSKGVMIEHRNLVNAYFAWDEAYKLRTATICHLQMASFSFDVFSGDLVRALCSGCKLVLCPRDFLLEPAKLYHLMLREKVDCAEFVPVVLRNLMQYLDESQQHLEFMSLLVCGSDTWYVREYEKLRQLCNSQTRLINSFGVTEATIDSSYFESQKIDLSKEQLVPIGRPFANTEIYILDKNLLPLPVGIPGEIYIGGAGVARGYLNRPNLTHERFIAHPYSNLPGTKLYKTGDLARYLPNGDIEYLGRMDYQVKIRGFRIEIGEIKILLAKHPEIQESVIAIKEDDLGEKRLVAYVVSKQYELIINELATKLRKFLQQKLPDYMIPSAFVLLETLPLTPNGKIDRRALPTPDWSKRNLEQNYVSPRTPVEEIIANTWTQVLGIKQVGVNDNFFELGGHSLLATQLISRLRQVFQIELPLQKVFEFPTVAGLATAIEAIKQSQDSLLAPPILPVNRENHLPLSFAQQRLWFLEQLQPNNATYNITEAIRVLGALNITALEASFKEIIKRHEALRTTFMAVEGLPMQVISANLQLSVPIIDLQAVSKLEQEIQVQQIINQENKQPFDLKQLPLLRVVLIKLSSTEYVVIFTMHHIISDAWSMSVIIREIIALYPALADGKSVTLPELPIQYADFTVWQRQWLQGQVLENHLAYWKQKLGAALPVLKLPYIQNQVATPTNQVGVQIFSLSTELTQALKTLSCHENATLFMTMVAALKTLLYRYTGQDDIVIGTDVANRNRGETEDLIGFFVNLLVLRTDISGYPTFRELLQRVRKVTLEAYAHQDLPFDKLVEELQPERHLSHTPLFQMLFIMDNVPTHNLQLPGLMLSPIEVEAKTVKFDLALFMSETESGIKGSWYYKTDLFDAKEISSLFDSFQTLLASITSQVDARINTLDLLTETQKKQQLVTEVKHEQGKLKKLMQIQPKAMKLS
ncbi:amino acid adenylation domain-containing protein [Calothrix sp. NIES-4101]|nr:amino acid adenylation domain-containing protein [Calothrix sp. NIES-4101]